MKQSDFETTRWSADSSVVYIGGINRSHKGCVFRVISVDFEQMSLEITGHGSTFFTSFCNVELLREGEYLGDTDA